MAEQYLWAGFTLVSNDDAGKKKSVRISKDGCCIKPLLMQYVNTAVAIRKHPVALLAVIFVFKSAVAVRKQLLSWQEYCITC